MHHKVLKGLLIISYFLGTTSAIEIDGKLDFGNSRSSPASFKSYGTQHRNTFVPVKPNHSNTITVTETNDNFDNIGIVCVSGGCNVTELTNSTEDSIQSDVLVHIQTKVNLNQDRRKLIGDIPDIPVVIGTDSKIDTTIDEEDSLSAYPQSQFVLDVDPLSQIPTYNQADPSISTSLDSSLNTYSSPFIGSSLPQPVSSRVDAISSSLDNFNPSVKTNTVYGIQRDPKVNINTAPRTSVTIKSEVNNLNKDTKYQANGIEIKIPFLDSSYQNHYHGENPPPQYVWYTKKSNSFNPVEFKTVKSTWAPSLWNRKISPHRHTTTTVGSGVQCTCKDGHTTPELRWYPSTSRGLSINDPGSQINDKLAPLN